MPFTPRRLRGSLLRLARRRALSLTAGVVLVSPAVWLWIDPRYATWWAEGLGLVLAGTGMALIYTGVVGVKPDWADSEAPDSDR